MLNCSLKSGSCWQDIYTFWRIQDLCSRNTGAELGLWECFPPFVMTLCQTQWWDLGLWEFFPPLCLTQSHYQWWENSHRLWCNTDTRQKKSWKMSVFWTELEKCTFFGQSWKVIDFKARVDKLLVFRAKVGKFYPPEFEKSWFQRKI